MGYIPNDFIYPVGVLVLVLAFYLLKNGVILPLLLEREVHPNGCSKIGIRSESNLSDQYDAMYAAEPPHASGTASPLGRVKALFVYPIKSCYPLELPVADVEQMGMKYDRKFAFAQLISSVPEKSAEGKYNSDHHWQFITQRGVPLLTKVKTDIWVPDPESPSYDENAEWVKAGGCMIVTFPDVSLSGLAYLWGTIKAVQATRCLSSKPTLSFRIPFNPSADRIKTKAYAFEKMTIWKDSPEALNMGSEIPPDVLAKLKYLLGVTNPLTLFRVNPKKPREVFRNAPTKEQVGYQPIVGFADAYPLHLVGIRSIRDINSKLPNKGNTSGLDARRFRANIYVEGSPAYAEDSWKLIRIGSLTYHVSCRTARCKLPNNDMETGILDVNEPLTTLRHHRQIDEGANPHPCLGMQMVPMSPSPSIIRVGDEVEVLESGKHYYIKQGTAAMAA